MGTLSYYLVSLFLTITKQKKQFLKKSLDTKYSIYVTVYDTLATFFLLSIILLIGIKSYLIATIITVAILTVVILEKIRGRNFLIKKNHIADYEKYMNVDWVEAKRVAKENLLKEFK